MKDMMDWFKDQKKLHRKCAYQVTDFAYSANSPSLLPSESDFFVFFQILVQVKDVLSKLPSLIEITLKEVSSLKLLYSDCYFIYIYVKVVHFCVTLFLSYRQKK